MSQDKMQDVFPIDFNFVSGEQPDSVKFTGWRKQTDTAFSNIVKAIGDPWEYNTHIGSSGEYYLSPSRLAQPSLARMIGPSDYASPQGASANEAITVAVTATLEANRNSWRLGFPLKKKIGVDMSPNGSYGYSGSLGNLVISVDISVDAAPAGQFYIINLKSTIEDVVDSGDWFIDYDKGTITSFDTMSSAVVLSIENMNMIGPGTPWGTANVIPTWEEGSDLCTVSSISTTSWTLSFPNVTTGVRSSGSTNGPDASWTSSIPGESAKYRLPSSITSALSIGDVIPEGFMILWDNTNNKIIPLITFLYKDAYSVSLTGPENWLTDGPNYRLLVTGSSLAENISWLMSVVRDTTHSGMSNGQDGRTISFTNPISHDDLSDLYTGALPYSTSSRDKYSFTKSNHPVNPHPQYIHRAGYMANDYDGNSANSMRGDLVFSAIDTFATGTGGTDSGYAKETYGVKFGGGDTVPGSILFAGGESSTQPIGFGLDGVGVKKAGTAVFGTVAHEPYNDMPFYLKSKGTDSYNSGASLGFDYMKNAEMNYLKLVNPTRTGANDPVNLPAQYAASVSWTTSLPITPAIISKRISIDQGRELRFRGVSYESSAINTGLTESGFEEYFTSPGVIGADFLNVYSNAIFFSEDGDGTKTSLTDRQSWFLNSSNDRPVGLYYEPKTDAVARGIYRLFTGNTVGGTAEIASFGYDSSLIQPYGNESYLKVRSVSAGTITDIAELATHVLTGSPTTYVRAWHKWTPGPTVTSGVDIEASTEVNIASGVGGIDIEASAGGSIYLDSGIVLNSSSATVEMTGNVSGDQSYIAAKFDGSVVITANGSGSDIDIVSNGNDINLNADGFGNFESGSQLTLKSSTRIQLDCGANGLSVLDLPTSDPGSSNLVWNDSGTLKIT